MTLMDVGASNPALAMCTTDWTATQDLSVYAASALTDGPVVLDCRLTRLGKKVIIVGVDVYDGHGAGSFAEIQEALDGGGGPLTLAARGIVTFARIPRTAASGVAGYDPGQFLGEERHRRLTAPPAGTMYQRMGLEVVDAGTGAVTLERTSYVINSIGTINGGALTVLAEAAAEVVAPGLVASDMQIHYLSQVKAGPARTRGVLVRDSGDHRVVAIEIVDQGNDDALLALATVTLVRPPR
jgi:acyl-coenzyme A thioesterase PaaI-like protein